MKDYRKEMEKEFEKELKHGDLEEAVRLALKLGYKGSALQICKDHQLGDGVFDNEIFEKGHVDIALELFIQSYCYPQAADCADLLGHKSYAKQLRYKAIEHELDELDDVEQAVIYAMDFGFDDEVLRISRQYKFDDCDFAYRIEAEGHTEAAMEVFKQTYCFGEAGRCAQDLGMPKMAKKLYETEIRKCIGETDYSEAAEWAEKLSDLGGCDPSIAKDLLKRQVEKDQKQEEEMTKLIDHYARQKD